MIKEPSIELQEALEITVERRAPKTGERFFNRYLEPSKESLVMCDESTENILARADNPEKLPYVAIPYPKVPLPSQAWLDKHGFEVVRLGVPKAGEYFHPEHYVSPGTPPPIRMTSDAFRNTRNVRWIVRKTTPKARCFEWVNDSKGPAFLIRFEPGNKIAAQVLNKFGEPHPCPWHLDSAKSPAWQEFPVSEWDTKVAARKAAKPRWFKWIGDDAGPVFFVQFAGNRNTACLGRNGGAIPDSWRLSEVENSPKVWTEIPAETLEAEIQSLRRTPLEKAIMQFGPEYRGIAQRFAESIREGASVADLVDRIDERGVTTAQIVYAVLAAANAGLIDEDYANKLGCQSDAFKNLLHVLQRDQD